MTVKKEKENKSAIKGKIHFKDFDVWNSVKVEIPLARDFSGA